MNEHLKQLEAESIYIMREVAAQFERPALLFSGGKDSITVRLVMKHSEEKQYTQSSDPENFIPKFRRRNLDKTGFLNKLARFAGRLGEPIVRQLYALYYLWDSPHTPRRAKMIIVGALVYFLSPIDSIPDLLIPFGFSDDIAVIALVYSQMKNYLTKDIQEKARQAGKTGNREAAA